MRLSLSCMQCSMSDPDKPPETILVEYNDEGAYQFKCHANHVCNVALQEQKFELLFEFGLFAIADGYYREAITSFAASLERFQEFVTDVICHVHAVPPALQKQAWKPLAKSSERQLGAYALAHLIQFHEVAPTLRQTSVETRNKAVHQGKIPTREQAVSFGEEVYSLASKLLHRLRKECDGGVSLVVSKHIRETRSHFPEDTTVQFLSHQTALNIASSTEPPKQDFSLRLAMASNSSRRWKGVPIQRGTQPKNLS